MKRRIAALTAALVTFPAVAFADPPDNVVRHWAPSPVVVSDDGDVASSLPALGTDVSAPDQQAATPAPPSRSAGDEFDWADAGVGALAGTALAAFAMAGAVGLRRRPSAPLAG